MEEKTYKYDAFISYRHCELDKFVAENLHKILENYELPKNLKKKLNVKGKAFKRVFRDQEELPLSSNLEDPILKALEDSKYLIVICSPRLKDSLWCKKEIETFKKLRGRKNIFCVLIEGEPADSFPEEVLFDEIEENGEIKKIPAEPLAADVRGKKKSEVLKKIKAEKLRLVAPMYNLDYDDLKQRHKIRRQKRILNISLITTAACILFTIYSLAMFIKINVQQNILASHQALSLASKAEDFLKKDNRYDAIKTSYQALTDFEEVEMPYTPEAEYALTESLGIYDVGASYKSISELKTKGVVDYIKSSEDDKISAIYDESEEITLFDSKSLNVIGTYVTRGVSFDENSFSFIGNDSFAYINENGNVAIVNTKNGEKTNEIEKENNSYIGVKGDSTGEYLAYTDRSKLCIYNIKENKKIGEIFSDDGILNKMYFVSNSKYIVYATEEKNYDINVEDHIALHVLKTEDVTEINNTTINAGYISGLVTQKDNAYILLNNTIGTSFNMIVVSYDYINGNINWTKTFDNNWGKYITRSFIEDTNYVAVVNYDTVNIFNMTDGNIVETFNASSGIIGIYSYINKEMHVAFLSNGSVIFMDVEKGNNVEYNGKFEFNIDEYAEVSKTTEGFLLVPKNENRVILYEEKTNKEAKEEDTIIDYPKNDSIYASEQKKLIEEYNIKNKNLIEYVFYDSDKQLLFVNYTNKDLAIYNANDKQLLNYLNNIGKMNHYFGKDKYGRIYLGDVSNTYIIDSNYNKVGHIKSLRKIEDDKLFIANNDKIYSLKIYSLKDALKEAETYLGIDK